MTSKDGTAWPQLERCMRMQYKGYGVNKYLAYLPSTLEMSNHHADIPEVTMRGIALWSLAGSPVDSPQRTLISIKEVIFP